jgi:hypothetical protein
VVTKLVNQERLMKALDNKQSITPWKKRDQCPYLFLRTLAMICCPRGDISVELAGDTGIRSLQRSTIQPLSVIFSAWLGLNPLNGISVIEDQDLSHRYLRTLQSFSWFSYADSALRWKGIGDLPLATSLPKPRGRIRGHDKRFVCVCV